VGGAPFNNLLDDCAANGGTAPAIDFAAHARSLGAQAEHVRGIAELEAALGRARASQRTYVVSIDTSPWRSTEEGGCWWEVAVPAVSGREEVAAARRQYEQDRKRQRQ